MPLSHYPSFCHVPALSAVRRIQEHPPSRGSPWGRLLCVNRGQLFLRPTCSWLHRKYFIMLYRRVLSQNVHKNNVVVMQ